MSINLNKSEHFTRLSYKEHKIYKKILRLNPKADPEWALELTRNLLFYSKKYKTDPNISISIAMQESRLRPIHRSFRIISSHNKKNGFLYSDLSTFQIHIKTIKAMGLDYKRLLWDNRYAVESHVKILSMKIKECRRYGKEAFSCYHSKTEENRVSYAKLVKRFIK
jgi:hypothetical protein